MTNRSLARIAVLIVANGLVGCRSPSAPTLAPSQSARSAISQPPASGLVMFTDPLTGLSTADVHDAQDHVVQFTTSGELVWIDGTRLAGHQVYGRGPNLAPEASCQCWLVVRFGATAGERRAYLTADVGHYNPRTLVNLEVTGGVLVVVSVKWWKSSRVIIRRVM